jgi:hypothetical protein
MKQQMTAAEFRALKLKPRSSGDKDKGAKAKTWLLFNLNIWAKERGLIVCPEFRFTVERKFRFDWAIPSLEIGIEYEGINSDKSGHTTFLGFSENCIKYNLATVEGWDILRYTAKNYKNVIQDLDAIYKRKIGG